MITSITGSKSKVKKDNDDIAIITEGLQKIGASARMNRNINIGMDPRAKCVTIDVCHSGTALRFLTAHAAATPYAYVILTGSPRLGDRPITHLIDSLRLMGANIEYASADRHMPLSIKGTTLEGGDTNIPGNVTSQYISALMLIAPLCKNNLKIHITSPLVSTGYIHLTAKLLSDSGIRVAVSDHHIHVDNSRPSITKKAIASGSEADWSAAVFWLAALAIMQSGITLSFHNLPLDSLQPDVQTITLFRLLGVSVTAGNRQTTLARYDTYLDPPKRLDIDCSSTPDAIPAIVVAACLRQIPFTISGASTLPYKECDRASALVDELAKCGYTIRFIDGDILTYDGSLQPDKFHDTPPISLSSHDDHRIAMALALINLRRPVVITRPECVSKSYPDFWNQLDKLTSSIPH